MIWNFSIAIYYFFLVLIRILIRSLEYSWRNLDSAFLEKKRKILFVISMLIELVIDFSLIAPITLMVLAKRIVEINTLFAIAVAAYTTYKVIIASINFVKSRKNENISFRQLNLINIKDALVSVLTLQNTLIMVFGDAEEMLMLSAFSSFAILAFVIFLEILFWLKFKKSYSLKNI